MRENTDMSKIGDFFKRAFCDIKESAKAQHEADKAEFAAVKAESRASFEEARAKGSIKAHKRELQARRDTQIGAANKRKAEAEDRIQAAKNK